MRFSTTTIRRYTLSLAFICFIALGMSNGMLGVAWPSMRVTFGLPLDALVAFLISSTIGFTSGSVLSGQFMSRIGIGRFLLIMNLVAAVGFIGYVVAPGWWVLVLLGVLTGWGAGAIDTGLNIYIAATRSVRIMNWMHAMFGVGATIGPLIMTGIIAAGLSWRLGYILAAAVHLILALLYVTVLTHLDFRGMAPIAAAHEPAERAVSPLMTLRIPIVLLSVFLFLLYTGVESTTGQWAYSLFTESRTISTYMAGIMTSLFWAMLTLGRILFGAAAHRIGIERLLRCSMIGTIFSAGLFMIPTTAVGFASVGFMGLSLAAIFPTLTSDTPRRIGLRHAANAIGLQTGAASVGFAILPGVAGVLAARLGLEMLGPYLLITSVMMLVVNEIAMWQVRRNQRAEALSAPAD